VGLPFRPPSRLANTRRALEVAEAVRRHHPQAFAAVDDGLYRAQWVDDADLGDPAVVDAVVAATGLDPGAVDEQRDAAAVAESMERAHAVGSSGTPSWWIDDRLLLPGVQARDTVERWVRRLQERP
jgi:predicted DsbA family dithiol-disulfide isomerase